MWDEEDSISTLHRLHRATLHFTNTEKTHIGNVHFSAGLLFIYFFICNREASAKLSTPAVYRDFSPPSRTVNIDTFQDFY